MKQDTLQQTRKESNGLVGDGVYRASEWGLVHFSISAKSIKHSIEIWVYDREIKNYRGLEHLAQTHQSCIILNVVQFFQTQA